MDNLTQGEGTENQAIRGNFHNFSLEEVGSWTVLVPHTVYPPREDTELISRAISGLRRSDGLALEIGCGSGAVTLVLASLGWNVYSCDVNPFAVAATKGNLDEHELHDDVEVWEAGIDDGLKVPENTSLILWNLPYLEPVGEKFRLSAIEEASLTDREDGGWSESLLDLLTRDYDSLNDDGLVLLLFRTDPRGSSSPDSWKASGWSVRSMVSLRIGEERLEVFALWRPGQGIDPIILEKCDSTMDEAISIGDVGWQRVFTHEQTSGRGRKGAEWNWRDFEEGGFSAAGWSSTLGEICAVEVFHRIDASISSYFEDTGWLPMPTVDELVDISWRGISHQLSRGVSIEFEGEHLRPIGITTNGELEAIGRESLMIIDDLDGLLWSF
ncbi:MAG: methyltransferase [Candidatus Thalassarchaeaceae archaeon]|nr:methyltransferase [Candidatus Thalassarchaeaceae archaeon]